MFFPSSVISGPCYMLYNCNVNFFLSCFPLPLLSVFFPVSVLTTSAAISGQDICREQLGELHKNQWKHVSMILEKYTPHNFTLRYTNFKSNQKCPKPLASPTKWHPFPNSDLETEVFLHRISQLDLPRGERLGLQPFLLCLKVLPFIS